jgi:hypothetical protein
VGPQGAQVGRLPHTMLSRPVLSSA